MELTFFSGLHQRIGDKGVPWATAFNLWFGLLRCNIPLDAHTAYCHLFDIRNLEICVKSMVRNLQWVTLNGEEDFRLQELDL